MEEADLRFWLAVPPDERATLVWQHSVEAFELATGERVERRLPRSAYRVVRR